LHGAKASKPFWDLPIIINELIVVTFGLLQQALGRYEAVKMDLKGISKGISDPIPFLTPQAILGIVGKSSYPGLIFVGIPVHAVLAPHFRPEIGRALLTWLPSSRQGAIRGLGFTVLAWRIAWQGSHAA